MEVGGMMIGLLAALPTLSPSDAGFLYYASDYAHTYRWNGVAWGYAPGDDGSDYFKACGGLPQGAGWQICDGSTVTRSTSTGSTAAVIVPDLTSTPAYLRTNAVASLTGLPVAASAPGITSPANTGSTAPTLSGSTAATAVTISGNTGNASATTTEGAGPGFAAAANHVHDAGTLAGASHSHAVGTLAASSHTHTIGGVTADAAGEPRHLDVAVYYRL